MRHFIFFLVTSFSCQAADMQALAGGASSSNWNRQELLDRFASSKEVVHDASVFAGDTVIAALSSGPNARLEITFTSLMDKATGFTIRFFQADGTDLYLPVSGNGRIRGGHVSLRQGELFHLSTDKQDNYIEGLLSSPLILLGIASLQSAV
jgi:hypothetical protein